MYFYDEFGQSVNQISLLPKSDLYHNFILLFCINIFIENFKKSSKIDFKIYSIFMNNDYKMP